MRGAVVCLLVGCSFEYGQVPGGPGLDGRLAGDGTSSDTPIDTPVVPGLVARWEFDEPGGAVAHDTSGVGAPLDLTIDQPTVTEWTGTYLGIKSDARLRSAGAASKISDACREADAVTVEAWLRPGDNLQTGPARILSISSDISTRNVMVAQIGATFVLRIRTSNTDDQNGTPDLGTGAVIAPQPAIMHVVITGDTAERAIYVDGQQKGMDALGGDFAGWDSALPALAANEEVGATMRAWHGELHRIVVYCRHMTSTDVAALFAAGL